MEATTIVTRVLPREGMLPGDWLSLAPGFSSISFVVPGYGHVVEGGGIGQRSCVAARCPRSLPVRRQAHRPYVHSPAGRVAPGPSVRFDSADLREATRAGGRLEPTVRSGVIQIIIRRRHHILYHQLIEVMVK